MGRSQVAGNSGNTLEVNSDGSLNVQLNGSNGAKANVDQTGSLQVKIAGTEDSGGGALGVNTKNSEIILPMDMQGRHSALSQVHTNQTIAPSATNTGSWVDMTAPNLGNGSIYQDVSITVALGSAMAHDLIAEWSHGGTSVDFTETKSGTGNNNGIYTQVKARYVRLSVKNTGGAPVTANSHLFFKM